ncbi:hypothetical protein MITS9509_01346 [Synechococcus sp. MIT S9509]|uniref:hypothetical protein n=1 Tax=Synechococcus sp. MIT S9509 TaxID=1801630 RepID=UPI0007BC5B08|nr:hypothetical protein [Synechococcus sp. MIT S9509]KZR92359.1 hypothetical protein MITS9509_01346 [Synechococcus sp. MIT S9509]
MTLTMDLKRTRSASHPPFQFNDWTDLPYTPALSRIVDLELHLEELLCEIEQRQRARD